MTRSPSRWWRYLRGLTPAIFLFAIVVGILIYAVENRLRDEIEFEENILKEWILETRVGQATLPELVDHYLAEQGAERDDKQDALLTHLTVLGDLTRTNQGLIPLFPFVYRMELRFDPPSRPPIVWKSNSPVPRDITPQSFPLRVRDGITATLDIAVQLRAFASRQEEVTRRQAQMRHGLSLIAIAAAAVALLWVWLFLRRERALELQEFRSREKLDALERQRLEEQILREEEELKRKEAEKQVLEARTKLYADISVLAGSYAHNIKNLLVRPNDLLQRCLTQSGSPEATQQMLSEARESLRAVSERTQQILRTVRRDLEAPVTEQLDLNQVVQSLDRQWRQLARDQWKLDLEIQLAPSPALMAGDASHLQQALENILCNARDATFEERNYRREQARKSEGSPAAERQDAILAAAQWRGRVVIKVILRDNAVELCISDNGIGMSPEVLTRCTEAHFTTKRDNALHEGLASGMGLGLSFVAWVVEQHQGKLEIDSKLHEGTMLRLRFQRSVP
jgi:signal transduction histidine kinase